LWMASSSAAAKITADLCSDTTWNRCRRRDRSRVSVDGLASWMALACHVSHDAELARLPLSRLMQVRRQRSVVAYRASRAALMGNWLLSGLCDSRRSGCSKLDADRARHSRGRDCRNVHLCWRPLSF
jgi:hypothetical protein